MALKVATTGSPSDIPMSRAEARVIVAMSGKPQSTSTLTKGPWGTMRVMEWAKANIVVMAAFYLRLKT